MTDARRGCAARALAAVRDRSPVGAQRAGEVAYLATLLLRAPGLCPDVDAEALLDRAWSAIDHGDALDVHHGAAAIVYLPFWRAGRRNERLEQELARSY